MSHRRICLTPFFAIVLLTGLGAKASPADIDWQAARGPLMTPWASRVSPETVWPEHPRPQLRRSTWLSLNGLWDYAVCTQEKLPPEKYEGKILVPFPIESALSGVMRPLAPHETLWYRRSFRIPPEWKGQRILLHFEAVDWQASVWLNGRFLGRHRGGYDAFEFDITNALRWDSSEELVVAVQDPTDASWQLRGKQSLKPGGCSYTACSGIWQTVWLEAVPPAYVEQIAVRTHLQSNTGQVRLTIGARMPPAHTVFIRAKLLEGLESDRCVASHEVRYQLPAAVKPNLVDFFKARSSWFSVQMDLRVEPVRPWSFDMPHLYGLVVELVDEVGGTVDTVYSYVGIREIAIGRDERGHPILQLNGSPVVLVGALDQGYWPDGIYTAPTDEALRFDIELAKRLGFNAVRKHVKVEPARWYYWCDRLGLLVLQDFPSSDTGDPFEDRARSPEAAAQWETEIREILRERGSHPCIIMWIVFNEGWGQFDTLRHVGWIKELDPTRLVNEASGFPWHGGGDVIDSHGGSPPPDPPRLSITSEDGGWGACAARHTWDEKLAWAYRTYEPGTWRPVPGMDPPLPPLTDEARSWLTRWIGRLFQNFWRQRQEDGRCGYFYTQLTDVETECNGLITYDRAIFKIDPEAIRRHVSGLRPLAGKELVPTARTAQVLWRYTTESPPASWTEPNFDDSSWEQGPAGFGLPGTPGAIVNTRWSTSQIWLRRPFELPESVLADRDLLRLRIHHDEDVVVYVNGVKAFAETGFLLDYEDVEITPAARHALRPGRNVIAITCRQTGGGQYIDAGLVLPPRPGEEKSEKEDLP